MNSIIPICYLSLIYKFLKLQVFTVKSMLTCKLNEKFNKLCNSLKSKNTHKSNAHEIKGIQGQCNSSINKVITLSSAPLLPSDLEFLNFWIFLWVLLNWIFSTYFLALNQCHSCQLSQKIRETPRFWDNLPNSRKM